MDLKQWFFFEIFNDCGLLEYKNIIMDRASFQTGKQHLIYRGKIVIDGWSLSIGSVL